MDKIFRDQIGREMEVYVNDKVVKSPMRDDIARPLPAFHANTKQNKGQPREMSGGDRDVKPKEHEGGSASG
ncbi:hypothetical protein CR513_49982, partial [Mucuna pruriens]